MHMQNLKANTVRTAFCALLVSFALVFAGAAQVAVAPTNAYALDTAKCTAKPNVSGSSDVLGGVETRITWEGQANPDEQIAGVTFTLPEGTTCEPGDTRATMLTGDDLMNAINSFSGFYLVTTTNPDNSPNAAFFVFGMVKHEDHYYVQLSLAENQSRSNLLANGEGVAVYAATPSNEEGAKPFAVSGARILFQSVTDESVVEELSKNAHPGAMFFEVTEVRPLG